MRLLLIRHGDPDYEHDCLTARGRQEAAALADEKFKALIGDKPVRKVIVVPGRIVNIVV